MLVNIRPACHFAPFSLVLGYEWKVAVRRVGQRCPDGGGFKDFRFLAAPPGCFYADPFVVEHAGSTYLFVEEYRYQTRQGVLCCLELDAAGECIRREIILSAPYHISYPFVFEHNGEIFLLPETSGNRCVELYSATEFPWRWQPCRTILSGIDAVDSTILFSEGRVWLFTAVRSDQKRKAYDRLLLYYADSLSARFVPHPANPIVADLCRARPAGRIFRRGDLLIRPAQDCYKCYGNRLRFQSILTLDTARYREADLGVTPEHYFRHSCGIHTYNNSEHWEVVDVCFHGIHGPATREHISRLAGRLTPHRKQ